MFLGKTNTSIISTGNALRLLKSCKKAYDKRNEYTLTGLATMKSEDDYKDVIREIGCNPFFVNYNNFEQIRMYRKYCSSVNRPQIIIDATRSSF